MWVCWLDGKPAVRLAETEVVLAALREFAQDQEGAPPPEKEPGSQTIAARPDHIDEDSKPGTEPEETPPDQSRERVEDRYPIAAPGTIRSAGYRREVVLRDLSTRGCRFVEKGSALTRGKHITIRIGSIGPIDAMVMWNRGEIVGVQFNDPLHPSVFDHIRGDSSFSEQD